ncbi:hypothetical protein [Thermococcus barophilus]|uniref:Uncharacterized protein n=1 Tax=Thermococcus barophilus TaxID=55802 RepID=A0A0S1XAP5_THEBA|nr:hypothetical protein [Thermococcus barophilus]ALM74831.1 hypothetical protein TBCH5v1_0878 [Thermococcus barophilus]
MRRKSATVDIDASLDAVNKVLDNPAQFITNWPYVVRISTKNGIAAEIMLPRFVFKFGDKYSFTFHKDSTSFIYEGSGNRSNLIVIVAPKKWQKNITAEIEVAYQGRGEFFLGKTLELLAEGIAKSLKELAESYSLPKLAIKSSEALIHVDFSDPMSVAKFLAKAKMVHSGLHLIENGKFFYVIAELKEDARSEVIYISGITPDGSKSFKVFLRRSQILAVEHREKGTLKTVKVKDEKTAKSALDLLSRISGTYMINVWVPVGGV